MVPFQRYVTFLYALHVESYSWDGTGLKLDPRAKPKKLALSKIAYSIVNSPPYFPSQHKLQTVTRTA